MSNADHNWTAADSQAFIDYGRYFVPDRETQIAIIVDFVQPLDGAHLIDVCCGEGLLAGALLDRYPHAIVHGLDGSPEMLAQARANLEQYGDRFVTEQIDLHDRAWRKPTFGVQAVVSSLAIHHLDDVNKQTLFQDMHDLLLPGGTFVVADLVRPTSARGWAIAAAAWDEAVRQRSIALHGDERALQWFERERWNMYRYFDPADIDQPSTLAEQLHWLAEAGFAAVDVYYFRAGHAIFGGTKT